MYIGTTTIARMLLKEIRTAAAAYLCPGKLKKVQVYRKWRSTTKEFVRQPSMLITFHRPSAHRYLFGNVSMHGGRGGVLNGCDMSTNNREFPEQVLLCLFINRTCCMPVNMGDKNVVHVMNMSVAAWITTNWHSTYPGMSLIMDMRLSILVYFVCQANIQKLHVKIQKLN